MKIALQFAMPSELHALPGARDLEPLETIRPLQPEEQMVGDLLVHEAAHPLV